MRIVFLDIDGVVNDHTKNPAGYCGIKPECVAHLNRVLDETDAHVVLTSAWRYMVLGQAMTLKGFEYLLLTHGVRIANRLLGVTVADKVVYESRGSQIEEWLSARQDTHEIASYVVIDDLDLDIARRGLPFVQTDSATGMTASNAQRAIDMLTNTPAACGPGPLAGPGVAGEPA